METKTTKTIIDLAKQYVDCPQYGRLISEILLSYSRYQSLSTIDLLTRAVKAAMDHRVAMEQPKSF